MSTLTEAPATTLPAGTTAAPVIAAPVTTTLAPAAAVIPIVVEKKTDAVAPAKVESVEKKSLLADVTTEEAKPIETKPDADAEIEITYSLKAPEKSALTAEDVKNIEAWAKEKHVSQEVAQAVVERESKLIETVKQASDAAAKAGVEKLYETWAAEAQKDPVIGGAKWAETQANAKRALNIDPDFKALISTSPFGNHPKVLAFLAKVGALTREDSRPNGGSVTTAEPFDLAKHMYPSSYKK